ncbi:hypothetical protein F511_32805 [Dorcoceras hygrometricum]|uniref:Uncharacterized protein n=1 Tax=Dorcoceras hygrometricum TaxID=472368 RepID=A0A2Z7CCZ1_9LAMI|nr:hypothetical protein F511_32805 [Dorcoceras hygrometricum]
MLTWQEAAATLTWISDVGVLVARISRQGYRTLKRRRFGEQEPAGGFVSAFLSSDQPLGETTSFWEFSSWCVSSSSDQLLGYALHLVKRSVWVSRLVPIARICCVILSSCWFR